MSLRTQKNETHVLNTLQELSAIARSAKRVEEISDAMNSLAVQANLMAMEAIALTQDLSVVSRLQNSVSVCREDLSEQFSLLLEEITELHQLMKGRPKEIKMSDTDLN